MGTSRSPSSDLGFIIRELQRERDEARAREARYRREAVAWRKWADAWVADGQNAPSVDTRELWVESRTIRGYNVREDAKS